MIDFKLTIPQRHLIHNKNSRSNIKIHQQHEISFGSYEESLKQLSLSFYPTQKVNLVKMVNFFNTQKSQKRSILEKNDHKIRKQKTKTQKMQSQFICEAKDQNEENSFQEHLDNNLQEINGEHAQFQVKQFTPQERQSLKNAFRYICRLVFKQAHKYSDKMSELFLTNNTQHLISHLQQEKPHTKKSRRQKSTLSTNQITLSQLNLLQQAQLISGERYFKQYLQKLQPSHRKILLNYMIWFLRSKYLRYINKCNNQNKGKRKQMKKDLYIRFKNNTMLPYLQALLVEITV